MLAVYTFVFSVVFEARWGIDITESRANFALALFTGILIHTMFSDVINRAPDLIVNNQNYVKQVVFLWKYWQSQTFALLYSTL